MNSHIYKYMRRFDILLFSLISLIDFIIHSKI